MYNLNKIRRFLAIAASLAALSLVATIAFRMQQAGSPAALIRKLPLQVDVALQKVHFTETRQGVKRWDLSAERAEFNKKTDTSTLTGVRLVLAGKPPEGELLITADRADYQNASKNVLLTGNVHGQSGSGMEFSTTRLSYLAAKAQLETGEPVRFKDAGLELEGVGMEFQTQTRRLKLLKDVNALYRPQGAK